MTRMTGSPFEGTPTSPFDGTVDAMADLIARTRDRNDRIAEFAAMYGAVTRRVRALSEVGSFDDADRMAAFVDRFAARFLGAVAAVDAGQPVTRSWSVVFKAAASWRPTVLQHLTLGMTAHIGLDLGVVAAEVASVPGGSGLDGLRPDFDAINDVLGSLVPAVQAAIGRLSPAIGLLDAAGGRADALAVSRVIGVARALAWSSAVELTPLTGRERAAAIAEIDERVAIASRAIAHPGPVMSSILLPIRLMERRSVAEAVDELAKIDG